MTEYGNKSGIDRHHRGAGILGGGYIIGRMGLPYRERGVNIISVVLDAPQDKIAALSGKIGRLPGVSAKTQYSNVISREGEPT